MQEFIPFMGEAIVHALEEKLGNKWSTDDGEAWRTVYGEISSVMMQGIRSGWKPPRQSFSAAFTKIISYENSRQQSRFKKLYNLIIWENWEGIPTDVHEAYDMIALNMILFTECTATRYRSTPTQEFALGLAAVKGQVHRSFDDHFEYKFQYFWDRPTNASSPLHRLEPSFHKF